MFKYYAIEKQVNKKPLYVRKRNKMGPLSKIYWTTKISNAKHFTSYEETEEFCDSQSISHAFIVGFKPRVKRSEGDSNDLQ